ncbi:helix-turn-helix domain-containing protein [Nocardia sp. NPDC006044]|uniref:helix-turn-helix domain-containing protein n=1 Tax=Nocardia sp. NPDC006044 TaxID=3364306 RepID=UPI0036A00495
MREGLFRREWAKSDAGQWIAVNPRPVLPGQGLFVVRFLRSCSNLVAAVQGLATLLAEARAEVDGAVDRPEVVLRARVRKLSDAEKAELARDYQRGMTVYQLAEKYGVQRQTVSRHLRGIGVTMRQQGLSEIQVDRAVELYVEERLTLKQVGAKLGADAGTVRLALLRRGVQMRAAVARRINNASRGES